MRRANDGKIAQLEIQGNDIKITPKDQSKPTEHSVKESSSIYEQGLNKDAKVEVKVIPPSTTGETMWNLAVMVVPVLIIVMFFMFMMRQAQGQNNQAMGLVRVRLVFTGKTKKRFCLRISLEMITPSKIYRKLLISSSIRRNIKIWAQRFQRAYY